MPPDEGAGDLIEPARADHGAAHAARVVGEAAGIEAERRTDPDSLVIPELKIRMT